MVVVGVARDFAHKVDLMRAQDVERCEWLEAAQVQLAALAKAHGDSCKDLERERIAGRDTQDRVIEWERRFRELQRSVDDASFVLVLIDADPDGYIFMDEYYNSTDGGLKAAWDLRVKIKEHLADFQPDIAHLPVLIKAVANGNGLSNFLSSTLSGNPAVTLWGFATEFSQSHALSDFILVSSGKDRADKKIAGLFNQFVRNPTCRHIIFGACHDNGYVRTLENFANDQTVIERVTLLQSFNVGHEFKKLPYQTMKLENLFRTSSPQPVQSLSESRASPTNKLDAKRSRSPTTWAATTTGNNTDDCEPSSSRTSQSSLQKTNVYINNAGQRIDQPLTPPSQAVIALWIRKIKKANMRYCRIYHLDGHCNGPCIYSHSPLSDEEKDAYRIDLRTQTCDVGAECRSERCHYRHHCSCSRKKCRFAKEMHGFDTKSAVPWVH